MKFTGQWDNPEFAGEGLTSIEYDDGTVIGYFFTYDDERRPLWLVCIGKRNGDHVVMRAWSTEGGKMGDPDELEEVKEIEWGTIGLTESSDDELSIHFAPLEGASWGYDLKSLYEPKPAVQPPKPTTNTVRLERLTPLPVVQLSVPTNDRMKRPEIHRHRLTVVSGKLTITGTRTSGPYHPRFVGLRTGALSAGDSVEWGYSIDKGYQWTTGAFEWSTYSIFTLEKGEIVRLSVQVQRT